MAAHLQLLVGWWKSMLVAMGWAVCRAGRRQCCQQWQCSVPPPPYMDVLVPPAPSADPQGVSARFGGGRRCAFLLFLLPLAVADGSRLRQIELAVQTHATQLCAVEAARQPYSARRARCAPPHSMTLTPWGCRLRTVHVQAADCGGGAPARQPRGAPVSKQGVAAASQNS